MVRTGGSSTVIEVGEKGCVRIMRASHGWVNGNAPLQPAHLQLELQLSFLERNLLQLQLECLLVLGHVRTLAHQVGMYALVTALCSKPTQRARQFGSNVGATMFHNGGRHGRNRRIRALVRAIWHVFDMDRSMWKLGLRLKLELDLGLGLGLAQGSGPVPARLAAKLLVRSLAALKGAADGARADDELVLVVQPPEHVVDGQLGLRGHVLKQRLLNVGPHDAVSPSAALGRFAYASEALELELPSSNGAVADCRLLFNLFFAASGLQQFAHAFPSFLVPVSIDAAWRRA